ncbi:MAG: hypothetical protein EZS28_028403 [Streblomastix strix]|uniref:Uncharacterized protein n=1 Tax=Streblomastix strix TaxID=222440 RepID=A0A5J4V1X9_9EUKA|nr:MAG: hypothetical protein EZS28_028403 [Streblomastix strix]
MADVDFHSLDVLIKHDEILFGSTRQNTIGLVEQVENINNQINNINSAPAVDLSEYYTKTEVDGLISDAAIGDIDLSSYYTKTDTDSKLDLKADKTELIDAYTKTETDGKLDLKLNIADLIDAYIKTETDGKLDLKADKTELIDAYTKTETDGKLDLKLNIADQIDAYTKTEDDALLDAKADKTELIDAYTKTETDGKLDLKADKTELIDAYTKTETDGKLDLKADKTELIDAYTKTETDGKLDLKADKTELDDYVDLNSVQTIYAYKQFQSPISVFNVSKQGKNDASILLAGGGDMLVSSLVTQPQLQEVRDIASGKSKGYVFATTQEMNTWMEDQKNVAKLTIGDNLYIIDKEVMDYWWDGSNLQMLETEVPDMSNVVTTLGAATGNGNAITSISIDGNTFTPAKNETFVTTSYDQNIGGQKTFTTIIHSVGIAVQSYDNNSVVCAGGGVKAISDIVSTVDLTDYYNKTKTDKLLSDKANSGDLDNYYDKHDVDEMINDANQLINDANELIRAVEDQIPPPATISNFVQKTGEDLDQTIQGRIRQQLDERVPFDSMSDNLYITKFDALEGLVTSETFNDQLLDKADKTDLDNYVTLGTSQSINANKTFNNACRFTSTIDGMSTITGASFVKSGAGDSVVLLGAGGTKPISEFSSSIDVSNYVDKSTDQTIGGNKTFSQQIIAPSLQLSGPNQQFLLANGGVIATSNYLSKLLDQTIDGTNTFNRNITAFGFIKQGGTNQQVLLANGSTKPLSEFSGGGGDMTNYVQKIGQTLQVVNGTLRKGDGEEESESEDEDYMTKGEYNTNTNQIVTNHCVRKSGQNFQNVRGRLLYVNPFGIEDDESQDLTNTTYPTWLEVSNAITAKFYNFYQVLTPPIMQPGFTASQSSLIKINNQMYFFYLVVKPDTTIQAYQGRDICTVNPPPLYTIFRILNSDNLAMFTDDGTVHFTTQATVWTQNSNVVINTFWVR